MSIPLTLSVVLLGAVVWYLSWSYNRRLPPGPPAVPIFGNIHHLPSIDELREFDHRRQQYGPSPSSLLRVYLPTWQEIRDAINTDPQMT